MWTLSRFVLLILRKLDHGVDLSILVNFKNSLHTVAGLKYLKTAKNTRFQGQSYFEKT